jgi:PAS domain S-box-containing protein
MESIFSKIKNMSRGKRKDRAEIIEVRRVLLNRVMIPILGFGLPAAVMGAVQSFQQGRWGFSSVYLGLYTSVLILTLMGRRVSYSLRAVSLIVALFIMSTGVLLRIGLSGVGLEIMIVSCVLASVLMGVRMGLFTACVGLLVSTATGLAMVQGIIKIYPEHMLTSTSTLAWLTSVMVFGTITFGLILVPHMFLNRLKTSLDVQENHTEELIKSNERLKEEIKARETAEAALRESEDRFRLIFQTIPDPVTIINAEDGRAVDINEEFSHLSGWSREETISKTAADLDLWENFGDRERLTDGISKYGQIKNLEARFKFKDGKKITGLMSAALVTIEGKPHIITITRDITERTVYESALKESEEKYRLVVENANEGIIITQGGRVVFVNERAQAQSGYSDKDLSEINIADFVHEEDREKAVERYLGIMNGETPEDDFEYRIVDRHGNIRWIRSHSVLIDWKDEPAVLTFMNEVTERKNAEDEKRKLEEHLFQAQKIEAIGTLAGGIAHDFNNLLMGIQGNASLILSELDPGAPSYEKLKSIEEYVKSGANLTKQLLGFARGGKYDVTPTDLNELIKKTSDMFGRTRKEITIHTKYQGEIWPVEIDRGQIEQVLLNLYVNAWQSMPGGGALYLETENTVLDKIQARSLSLEPGYYVKIGVTDTGVGMDQTTQERIFEPFFTTKEMGRGTGLGLASVYGIIRNHGGMVSVYSEKGVGSTFNIFLPVTGKKVAPETEPSQAVMVGKETVLLVDDEEMIIDVGKQLLKKLGYKVLIARSGEDAIGFFSENKGEIDIVILDMIMPGMGGGETFDRLKDIDPDVRVLLSSGYSIDGRATEILNRGCKGFLQKPFNMKALSQKLREVLEGS